MNNRSHVGEQPSAYGDKKLSRGGDPEPEQRTRITQQFREAHNMTYELNYAGTPLIVRVFPLDGEQGGWRIEARMTEANDAVVATATGSSRSAALDGIAEWWRRNALQLNLATFDWVAIAQAMTAVRAL